LILSLQWNRNLKKLMRIFRRFSNGTLESYLHHFNLGLDGFPGHPGGVYLRAHRLHEPLAD
jgi:hypothetical protein